jgi:hypothetical protein
MKVTGSPEGRHSGPFESSDEVLALPAVQAVYAGFRTRPGQGLMAPLTVEKILEPACRAAGVDLGAHDKRILAWLASFGPAVALAAMAGGGAALAILAPWWMQALAAAPVLPLLARAGRPAGKPIITPASTSHRCHVLWVADRDPLAVPVGRTPLLACKATDIWKPAPFGLNERGQLVSVPLLWNSVLVSALPRQGKTFAARSLALYAALDPYVRLDVFDFKGSPDWRRFDLVAHSYGFGMTPARYGLPLDIFADTLLGLKRDVQERYAKLSELPPSVCPEGKLTREVARDPQYGMPVRVVVLDEFQEVFDLGEDSKEIASLLVFLVKVAPAAGVTVLGATQRPTGVGSGQVAQQFTSFRDNFGVRFGLRTSSWRRGWRRPSPTGGATLSATRSAPSAGRSASRRWT